MCVDIVISNAYNLNTLFAFFLLNKGLVSWGSPFKYSMIDCFLGDAFGVLSSPFWSTVLFCGPRLPIHTLNTGPCSQWTVVKVSLLWVCLSVTLHIVVPCRYYVCCRTSAATLCTIFMVLCQCRMCRCVLHVVLWSQIGTPMLLLTAEPNSTAELMPLSVSLWNDLVDRAFDGEGLAGFKTRAMPFIA